MIQLTERKHLLKIDLVEVKRYVAGIFDRFEPEGFDANTDGIIYVLETMDSLSALQEMNLLTQDRLVEFVNETNDLFEVVYLIGDAGGGVVVIVPKATSSDNIIQRCCGLAHQLEGLI
jgi:hypothetical protein